MLSWKQRKQPNFSLGHRGEARAVKFLKKKNYQILDVNVRVKNSELDIVAWDRERDEIVFVEVKTRRTDFYGSPSEAVNDKKLATMMRVASHYLQIKRLAKDYRFDIITITPSGVRHFENVSWL